MAGGTLSRLMSGAALCTLVWASPLLGGGLTLPESPGGSVSAPSGAGALAIFVGPLSDCCDGRSAMAGRLRVAGGTATFTPAFGFEEGQSYTVRLGQDLTEFTVAPKAPVVPPEVIAIYPEGAQLPENTLRFHIQFTTPMQPHRAAEFISLIGPDGTRDDAAFMAFKQELWNEDRSQLTLLMDPGRIKRGVAQNVALGPALLEGNAYTLLVSEGWPAAFRDQTAPRFEKRFVVSAPLRTLPDPALWEALPPRRKSLDPLVIRFDRPFDRQALGNALSLRDAEGQAISGQAAVLDDTAGWQFIPDTPWSGHHVDIHIDPRLEDVAGNNFHDLLDHALGTPDRAPGALIRRVPLSP